MVLPIKTYPDPVLRKKSKTIKDPTDPKIKKLVFDMLDTLEKSNGLGLAASQVGESLRLCVIKIDGKTFILANPKIVSTSLRKEVMDEGCLSFPGEFIPIKRSKKVKVTAMDKDGNLIEIKAEGMFARALQHEIDHLDGVLFIDRK